MNAPLALIAAAMLVATVYSPLGPTAPDEIAPSVEQTAKWQGQPQRPPPQSAPFAKPAVSPPPKSKGAGSHKPTPKK
jgi:hypothetical protein